MVLNFDQSTRLSTLTGRSTVSSMSLLQPRKLSSASYLYLRRLDLSAIELETSDYLRLVYVVEHSPLIEALNFSHWKKTVE